MPKKEKKWIVTPKPGPHKKFESIPLLIIVRDLLKLADTVKEVNRIIKNKEVLVDGKPRVDRKYPVGLFDVIHIPKIDKQYRVVPSRTGLKLIEVPKKEANLKLSRIRNKTMTKGGILQLNLHDGKNILLDKKEEKKTYNTGDSLLLELPKQKILEHIKMEKEATAILTAGQNMGDIAKIKDIIMTRSREPNKVLCTKDEREFEAIIDYVFVVGKTKPVIKIE
jgi:small subunit ribosomal protein S4e